MAEEAVVDVPHPTAAAVAELPAAEAEDTLQHRVVVVEAARATTAAATTAGTKTETDNEFCCQQKTAPRGAVFICTECRKKIPPVVGRISS
jgi:hypothetical protein